MKRRNFIKSIGGTAAVAVVAPHVILEPISEVPATISVYTYEINYSFPTKVNYISSSRSIWQSIDEAGQWPRHDKFYRWADIIERDLLFAHGNDTIAKFMQKIAPT